MKHVYHQGCLDDLCGPYAVINAIHRVLPDDVDEDLADKWYEKIFKKHDVRSKLHGGTTWKYVEELASYAVGFINKKLKKRNVTMRLKVGAEKWPRGAPVGDLIKQVSRPGRACRVLLVWDSEGGWHYLALNATKASNIEWIDSSEYFAEGYPGLIKSTSSFSLGKSKSNPRARYVIDRKHLVVTAEEITA